MSVALAAPTPPGQALIAERAYHELRDRIVKLQLAPGTVLREDELMAELGIGRTPLREAVKRLALEGFVAVQPRRGTYVTEVDAAEIVHITEVRAELESYAAQLAARRMDAGARRAAEALLEQIEAMAGADDQEALMALDERIHSFVWQASGNPVPDQHARALLLALAADLVRRARPRARARPCGARPGRAPARGDRARCAAGAPHHARARARVPARDHRCVQPQLISAAE